VREGREEGRPVKSKVAIPATGYSPPLPPLPRHASGVREGALGRVMAPKPGRGMKMPRENAGRVARVRRVVALVKGRYTGRPKTVAPVTVPFQPLPGKYARENPEAIMRWEPATTEAENRDPVPPRVSTPVQGLKDTRELKKG